MLRTLEQNKRYHTLLGELGITDKEQKEELVFSFTNERTIKSSRMEMQEMHALCNHLQGMVYEMDDRADKMRKKILSICHEMKWKDAAGKVNWDMLNDWLNMYGYLHKGLDEYTEKELPKLVTQFEGCLRSYYAQR